MGWERERGEGAGERGEGTYPFAFALVFLPPLPPPFAPVKQAKLRNRKYSYIVNTGFLLSFEYFQFNHYTTCCLNMLQEIIPIMDFNRNYNLVPSRSIARFLLTVVTSVKLDDFRHFMRFSPGCLNIGSECLCLFFIVSFFLLWLGNSRISFLVSFFQATFTFCPSPIPHFHSPLFPGVLFFILKYIKPGRGAFDLGYGMK